MDIKETTSFILSGITLIGVIFAIYKYFREPDIKTDKEMELLKQSCQFKHSAIDSSILGINKSIAFIKENHLTNIEASVKALEEGQIKLFTILEERLPKK